VFRERTNLLGQVGEVISDCFLLRGVFSRDRFSRLHHESEVTQRSVSKVFATLKRYNSRLAYTLVHLDILAPWNRIQLLRCQLEDLLLPVLACDLRIDDGERTLRGDCLEKRRLARGLTSCEGDDVPAAGSALGSAMVLRDELGSMTTRHTVDSPYAACHPRGWA
jgi:hypothetical protein